MYMNDGNKTKINLRNKSVFITGVAGFIGSNLAKRLLSTVEGVKVVGLDNMNHYYDVRLKEARLNELEQFDNFSFVKGNLADKAVIESIFEQYKPEIVVNLGAQAGVRYSITNPDAYVEANLIGFYVDKDRLVRFNGFFPKPQSGTYLILDEGGYQVAGQKGTWLVSDEVEVDGQRFVQMRSEQTKNPPPSIILHESGAFVTQTALGFDGEATRKMSAFLQGQKPELLHHQKFFENGTAERAKESGTEQNYNMIDGCVNNVPQKPRRIGGRWSVLDRLHIKQAERRQKDNAPQQEQERSRKS